MDLPHLKSSLIVPFFLLNHRFLTLTFLVLLLSAVLCVLPQFAAAGSAVGVGLHEELHLHHRETLRPVQPEVRAPGLLQRGKHKMFSADFSSEIKPIYLFSWFTSILLVLR